MNFNATELLYIFLKVWGNALIKYKMSKYLSLNNTASRYEKKKLFAQTSLGEVFGVYFKNPVKLVRTRKVWYLLLHVLWLLLPKFNLCKGDWSLDYVRTKMWDFSNISLFPNIISLKSFGHSCGNSYTKFAFLVTRLVFTCG